MKRHVNWAISLSALAALAIPPLVASAQDDFPRRTVRIVVPYAPSGSFDPVMRSVANLLQPRLGQPVVIENRTGGDLIVGARAVLQAPADGHTLFAAGGSITTWKILHKDAPDPLRDFAPVTMIIDNPGAAFITSSSVPARTMEEFIAYAKKNPNKVSYGHASRALMLNIEWLKQMAGIEMVAVPYKGGGEVLPALLANTVQFVMDNPANYLEHAKAGRVVLLAYTAKERPSGIPELRTTEETGLKGLITGSWLGAMVKAGTPRGIVERLNREVVAVLKTHEFGEFIAKFYRGGSTPNPGSPKEMADIISAETARFADVAKRANIGPD